jgi:hypothetical protein
LSSDVDPVDAALEGVVGGRHEVEHPRAGEVEAQQQHALGLAEVRLDALPEVILGLGLLNEARVDESSHDKVVDHDEDLANSHAQDAQRQADRRRPFRCRHAAAADTADASHRHVGTDAGAVETTARIHRSAHAALGGLQNGGERITPLFEAGADSERGS